MHHAGVTNRIWDNSNSFMLADFRNSNIAMHDGYFERGEMYLIVSVRIRMYQCVT